MAALRTDDGLVEGAVAALDSKMAAWLAAMREGQAALRDDAVRVSTDRPADTPLEQPDAGSEQQQQGVALRRGSKLFHGPVPAPSAAEYDRQTEFETPVAPSASEAAAEDDEGDEALLASLDLETASVIQVKRRLAGNKRSIRELLDEIRVEQSGRGQTDSEHTRRWRRGDERHDR